MNQDAQQLMNVWESQQVKGTWDWDTFKEMLREAKRYGVFPSILPQLISLSPLFKSLCKSIRDETPINMEVGCILYIDNASGKLISGPVQKGNESSILIKDTNQSPNLIKSGSIHRHPDTGYEEEDPLDYFLGVGRMWFSHASDKGGDIIALMLSKEIFSIVLYKNYVGFAIKTNKTLSSRDAVAQEHIIRGFLQAAAQSNDDIHTIFSQIKKQFGIEFFYTNDFEVKPLERLTD